jgi:hypothetical protein
MSDSEKSAREQMVLGSVSVLDILSKILRKERAALERKYDYNSAAWQYELAMDNGQKKKIDDLLNLIDPVIEKE